MNDIADAFNDLKAYMRAIRRKFGVECPICKRDRPKGNASILLPRQTCKVDKYYDGRARLTEEQIKLACEEFKAPYFEKIYHDPISPR